MLIISLTKATIKIIIDVINNLLSLLEALSKNVKKKDGNSLPSTVFLSTIAIKTDVSFGTIDLT